MLIGLLRAGVIQIWKLYGSWVPPCLNPTRTHTNTILRYFMYMLFSFLSSYHFLMEIIAIAAICIACLRLSIWVSRCTRLTTWYYLGFACFLVLGNECAARRVFSLKSTGYFSGSRCMFDSLRLLGYSGVECKVSVRPSVRPSVFPSHT